MNQFAGYAKYYDDMYQNKDYLKETDLIEEVFSRFSPHPVKTVLSLGCGTCTYEIELAKRGYVVTGIDISADMLKLAKEKITEAGVTDQITLIESDIRTLPEMDQKYDAAIMMFNIAGYQRTTTDMAQVSSGVSTRIKDGSVFLFDAWYGPAVILDPPTDRTKIIEKPDGTKLTRITRGSLDEANKLVKIQFEVIDEQGGQPKADITEDHPMRYWDIDELNSALREGGLKLLKTTSFTDLDQPVSNNAWDMQVIAHKV